MEEWDGMKPSSPPLIYSRGMAIRLPNIYGGEIRRENLLACF
jgi:hypothetical protein